jgi:hypothetical protein
VTVERFDEDILYENAQSVLFDLLIIWSRIIPDCEPDGDSGIPGTSAIVPARIRIPASSVPLPRPQRSSTVQLLFLLPSA